MQLRGRDALAAAAAAAVLVAGRAAGAHGAVTCRASTIHYRNDPVFPAGVNGVPWIASSNGAVHGYLFYLGGTRWLHTHPHRAMIFTTGSHVRGDPKVLWVAGRPAAGMITIVGTRLDGAGTFAARYPAASGGHDQFPSFVKVPTPGCWLVRLRSGAVRGSVTFDAVDLQ